MKFYFHPISTASRPVALFLADAQVEHEAVVVDLMSGAHFQPPFLALNPSHQVPVLEDGDFVLTESSAILKYLADKLDSPAYPKDLRKRARVNERMDWFNTNFYREWCHHLIFPQVLPTHTAQQSSVAWGKEKSEHLLGILDRHVLGDDRFLCGAEISIADYFGAGILSLGVVIGASFARYPNVDRWMRSMRALPSWSRVNEAIEGFAASIKGRPFVTIEP